MQRKVSTLLVAFATVVFSITAFSSPPPHPFYNSCLSDVSCIYTCHFNSVSGVYSFANHQNVIKSGTATVYETVTKIKLVDNSSGTTFKMSITLGSDDGVVVYNDAESSLNIIYTGVKDDDCSCDN